MNGLNILRFSEIDKTMTAIVGGKGANLGEMTQAGFPVPPGFCLTTAVYDEFAAGLDLDSATAENARRQLAERSLPESCLDTMREVLREFPDGTLFSIRSSATAEDLPYASFAGQQDTYLNVPLDGLEEAIKNCFISLYTDRAVSYRQQNGITRPSMSVVVQKMVHSDSSGVMFSVDPVSGRRSTLVIDAIFGLGEAIVSGLVSPDHIEYDKATGKILKKTIACKSFAIRSLPDGGTENVDLNSSEPVLTDDQIRALATIGCGLEEHYGKPQDTEWAIENGELFIVQTRAITSLYPAPDPFADGRFHFLYNMGYQQMNTNAMPMMSLDCMTAAFSIETGDARDYKSDITHQIGQHLFADYSLILGIKPIGGIMIDHLLPVTDPLVVSAVKELESRKHRLGRPGPNIKRLFRVIAKTLVHFATTKDPVAASREAEGRIVARSDAVVEELSRAPVEPGTMNTIFQDLPMFQTFADSFVPMLIAGVISLRRVEEFEDEIGCKGKWTDAIQIGNKGNIVTEMGLLLGDMADTVAADPELRKRLESFKGNPGAILPSGNDAFDAQYRDFMDRYGFRCAGELDISQPRYEEYPSPLIDQIISMSNGKEKGSHRREYEEKNAAAVRAGNEFIEAVESKLGKRKAMKAKDLLTRYQSYYPYREHFKYYWMRNFGEARKLILRFGEKMSADGLLERPEDILHLHMKEVMSAMENGTDMRSLVEERRIEFERVSRLTPPRIITSEGEVLMGGLSVEGLPENALAGVGISPGTAEGIAKVVLDPKNAVVKKGEILIAPFTDPGWTPLFVDASALITEVGGMLTHGSVVAREYGIPGVVGVVDATKKIKTGQRLRVDGTSGIVEILDGE